MDGEAGKAGRDAGLGVYSQRMGEAHSGLDLDGEFQSIVAMMGNESHGSKPWKLAQSFFSDRFSKSQKRSDFIKDRILRDPVQWESARHDVWPSCETSQNDNRFHVLQGDIILTNLVEQVGGSVHTCWMILSADCDAARSDYVRVAPVHRQDVFQGNLALALALKSPKFFPLPRLSVDPPSTVGCYVNLELQSLLCARNGALSVPTRVASLSVVGWHLLNAQVIHQVSRAERWEESVKLRAFHPAQVSPPAGPEAQPPAVPDEGPR